MRIRAGWFTTSKSREYMLVSELITIYLITSFLSLVKPPV